MEITDQRAGRIRLKTKKKDTIWGKETNEGKKREESRKKMKSEEDDTRWSGKREKIMIQLEA